MRYDEGVCYHLRFYAIIYFYIGGEQWRTSDYESRPLCVCVFITAVPITTVPITKLFARVCVLMMMIYYCSTYYKAVLEGGGGEWRTCTKRGRCVCWPLVVCVLITVGPVIKLCVSLFYVIDTGSTGPRARPGDRIGGYPYIPLALSSDASYADLPLTLLGAPVSIGALLKLGSRSPGAEPQGRD
jgi:hypothetical protein